MGSTVAGPRGKGLRTWCLGGNWGASKDSEPGFRANCVVEAQKYQALGI